jgi:hypothetical protein
MNRAKDSARIKLFAPFDPAYAGYWVEGLRHVGTIELHPLPTRLPPSTIAFEIGGRKFVIDAWDKNIVNEHWLQWSDVYGKVNLPLDTNIDKVVPLGPWTITKAWGIGSMAWTFMQSASWGKGKRRPHRADARGFLLQYKRMPSNKLVPTRASPTYIFSLHRHWPSEPEVNEPRALFMREARSSAKVTFEGGFCPCDRDDPMTGYSDLRRRRLSHRKWMQLTRRSAAVFNSQGVYGCLDVKLGDYLALGKAIISMPVPFQLPSSLEHGTHIHVIDGSEESMKEAIERIVSDPAYRLHLEANARAYFDKFSSPRAVIQYLVSQT